MKTQIAKLNYLKIAPRKVRGVTDLVKGLSVNDAEAQLMVQRRRPAVQRSRVAHAETIRKRGFELLDAQAFADPAGAQGFVSQRDRARRDVRVEERDAQTELLDARPRS